MSISQSLVVVIRSFPIDFLANLYNVATKHLYDVATKKTPPSIATVFCQCNHSHRANQYPQMIGTVLLLGGRAFAMDEECTWH